MCDRFKEEEKFMLLDKKEIGKRLIMLRGDLKREVVAKANNISVSALTMYETGQRIPRDEIKVDLAKFYNTSVGTLFYAE